MSLTQYELNKLKEIEDELHLNLDNLIIRLYVFKYFTGDNVDVFTKNYLELEKYKLFWNYHMQSIFLVQPDLRLFYTSYFIPNFEDPIDLQIRNFERDNLEPSIIKDINIKKLKVEIVEKIPELKTYEKNLIEF
jgi:hypothetical protein